MKKQETQISHLENEVVREHTQLEIKSKMLRELEEEKEAILHERVLYKRGTVMMRHFFVFLINRNEEKVKAKESRLIERIRDLEDELRSALCSRIVVRSNDAETFGKTKINEHRVMNAIRQGTTLHSDHHQNRRPISSYPSEKFSSSDLASFDPQ